MRLYLFSWHTTRISIIIFKNNVCLIIIIFFNLHVVCKKKKNIRVNKINITDVWIDDTMIGILIYF